MQRAFITGVSGPALTQDERAFFLEHQPCGLILFTRNCVALEQIQSLVADVKDLVNAPLLFLIDQEGGRVQRLRPPLGRALPPGASFAKLYEADPEQALEAAFLISRLVAEDLLALGINTNCTPVLDVPVPGADAIIGDRALGDHADTVAAVGRAIARGYLAGGVLPVIKHIPGHGRADADSHLKLPIVETEVSELQATDFAPFRALSDLPLAMTAHVVFTKLDPNEPASTSPSIIRDVIRGQIGFDGLLMSDDVSMQALDGPISERTDRVLKAGSDVVLHCNGDFKEMVAVAHRAPYLEGKPLNRLRRAQAKLNDQQPFDRTRAEVLLGQLRESSGRAPESV